MTKPLAKSQQLRVAAVVTAVTRIRANLGVITFALMWPALILLTLSPDAMAAGGDDSPIPKFLNAYKILAYLVGLDGRAVPFLSGLFSLVVLGVIGYRFKRYVARSLETQVEPSGKFSLETITETIAKLIADLGKDLFHRDASPHTSLIAALFFFILITNLSGLCPFLPPASGDFSANLGVALVVFCLYNLAGIRAQGGLHYLAHFAGPKVNIPVLGLLLPILIFAVELISHGFRPVSLSLRLMGNIFGDHMLVGVFTGIVYWILPSILLFFGVLVSLVQAFVFSLLSGIYVALAVSDH